LLNIKALLATVVQTGGAKRLMALMTYLVKDRHGTYYFRRVIPPALRPFMPPPWTGKANFKLSLRTKSPKQAKAEVSKVLPQCMAAFESAERALKGEPPIKRPAHSVGVMPSDAEIEADVIEALLKEDEAEREEGDDRRRLQTPAEREQWPDLVPVEFGAKGMAEEYDYVRGPQLVEEAKEYREAYARRSTKMIEAELRIYLKGLGVPIDPDSSGYRKAGLAMLRGKVRGYDRLLARQAGDVVETPARPSVGIGPRLSEALKAWTAGGTTEGAKKPGRGAVTEAGRAVRRFIEWHEDLRLGSIDKAKARDFRDALARVRTRLPHDVFKLPLRELLKRNLEHLPRPHANTINKSMNLLSAVVAHAMREGELDKLPNYANPFKGMKLITDERDAEGREFFDAADLRAIFSTKVYNDGARPRGGRGEAAFWLPLIALLSGARQNEIAQLRVDDLRQDPETGVWYFAIGTEGGRSIKTASSRRKVPVHPHLVAVGLLRYRQSIIERARGDTGRPDLWPGLVADTEGRRAGSWSKWFNRYLRDAAKVTDASKVFHSFRHTMKRLARDAGLTEETHDALTGHSGGGVGRSYGKGRDHSGGFGLTALAEAMSRIETPEAVRGLRWAGDLTLEG
jgi:integrase